MKIIIKTLAVLFILPGFIFDSCLGFAFMMDQRGRTLGEWACNNTNLIPEYLQLPFGLSVILGIIPAVIFCLVVFFGSIFLIGYVFDRLMGSLITAIFNGELKWKSFLEMTDN